MADESRGLFRRRQHNVAGGRPFRHNVVVSEEEEMILIGRASALGVTVPRLLVECALGSCEGGGLTVEQRAIAQDLIRLGTLLQAIGRNVNQLAKVANSTGTVGEIAEELVSTLGAVRRTMVRVDELAEQVLGA